MTNQNSDEYVDRLKKPNLLMYAHYYHPDVASTGQILKEQAEGMLSHFNITVICVVPSYGGSIATEYKQNKFYIEDINGVKVIRVRVPEFTKSNKLSRIKNIIAYFFGALLATMKSGQQDYVYTISQPPVLGGLLGVCGKWMKKAKLIYCIQDFNPEQIIAVGYSKSKVILSLMLLLDKFSCKRADKVIVVGRDMVQTLQTRFKNSKIPNHAFINNWIDESEIYPLHPNHPKVTQFKEKYGLTNKLVIMYSGNIGLYYDLENIIKVIGKFKENEKVAFAFIGEGTVKDHLVNYSKLNELDNVIFIPYQPKEELNYSLNAGDLHWVVNAQGIKGVSVPSKLYGVMAAGKPVLGVLDEATEARLIIEEANCGVVTDPGNYMQIEKIIQEFIDTEQDLIEIGRKGRSYLEKHLTKRVSIDKYIGTICNVHMED